MTLRQLITNAMTRAGESPEIIERVIANASAKYPPGTFDHPLTEEESLVSELLFALGEDYVRKLKRQFALN